MRVVLLVTDFQRGGTPLRIARLARGLAAAGLDVHAGCLAPPGPVSGDLAAAGIPTFACHARGPHDLAALWRLTRNVRRLRPDLIHATLTHANVAARLAGLFEGIPVIGSTATIEVERRWHRWAERVTGGLEHAHLVGSRVVAEHVVRAFRRPRQRVHVVPPSLDPWPQSVERRVARSTLGLPEDAFVVAWTGRFDPVKRLDLVVACAERLADIPAWFLLAGDGPQRTHVEQLLNHSPARPHVQLLGWRDDVPTILSAADVFLFPSRTEGMPNAVLEAMACGVAIVGSDIPALRELAGDEGRLRLVAGDRPADFAAALRQLRENETLRRTLGGRAATWACENLRFEATLAAVRRVYEHVLE